jgi:hypothetical protein
MLNIKTSWISREAVLVMLFLAGATATTALGFRSPGVIWAVACAGWAGLLAMDMVYRVPGQTEIAVPHSAMATVTAGFYLGLLLTAPALAIPAAAVKGSLYLARRRRFERVGAELAGMRVVLGLLAPVAMLFVPGQPVWAIFGLAALGELIDRAEFYAGLEFLTPDLQVRRDLQSNETSGRG